jgi:hypothetical protein
VSVKYDLWASGKRLAQYHTLGQALLGALWRSKKRETYVYVHKINGATLSRCVAAVTGDDAYSKF